MRTIKTWACALALTGAMAGGASAGVWSTTGSWLGKAGTGSGGAALTATAKIAGAAVVVAVAGYTLVTAGQLGAKILGAGWSES